MRCNVNTVGANYVCDMSSRLNTDKDICNVHKRGVDKDIWIVYKLVVHSIKKSVELFKWENSIPAYIYLKTKLDWKVYKLPTRASDKIVFKLQMHEI